jgi:hypothetical protein
MNLPRFPLNPYYRASLVLGIAAVILVILAVLTNRYDLTTAALVLAGLTCLITGIFLSLLSTSEPLDARFVSLLPVQSCINLCRVAADLGIQGNAHVVPAGKKGMNTTMQFIPVADYDGSVLPQDTFVDGTTTAGLLVPPSGYPLLQEMRGATMLAIPEDGPALHELLKEVMTDVLGVAERGTVRRDGSTVTITLEGFRLLPGCTAMNAESPACCTMNPCPSCSVMACILAEGTGAVVRAERCSPDREKKSVTAIFTLVE